MTEYKEGGVHPPEEESSFNERRMAELFVRFNEAGEELRRISQQLEEKMDALKAAGKFDMDNNRVGALAEQMVQDLDSAIGNSNYLNELLDSMKK